MTVFISFACPNGDLECRKIGKYGVGFRSCYHVRKFIFKYFEFEFIHRIDRLPITPKSCRGQRSQYSIHITLSPNPAELLLTLLKTRANMQTNFRGLISSSQHLLATYHSQRQSSVFPYAPPLGLSRVKSRKPLLTHPRSVNYSTTSLTKRLALFYFS